MKYSLILILIPMLWLTACSDAPQLAAVKQQLQAEIPEQWQVTSFNVEAEEETGTKVSPVWQYRFNAEIAPKEAMHHRIGRLQEVDILEVTQKKNEKFKLNGLANSALYNGEWQVGMDLNLVQAISFGMPLSHFPDKHVIAGSSDYKKLLKTAKEAQQKIEQQIATDEQQFQQLLLEYNKLQQELQTKAQQSSEQLNTLQQQSYQQRDQLAQQLSSQNVELRNQLQQQRQAKAAEFRQIHDKQAAEIESAYRLQSAEFKAARTKAQDLRTEQRNAARKAHAAETQSARSTMQRADYTLFKAQADEKLRAEYQQIDQTHNTRVQEIAAAEKVVTDKRRADLAAIATTYRQQVDALSAEQNEQLTAARSEASQQQQQAGSDQQSELQSARNKHQALLADNNRQLNELRQRIDQLQRRIHEQRSILGRESQLLAQLDP